MGRFFILCAKAMLAVALAPVCVLFFMAVGISSALVDVLLSPLAFAWHALEEKRLQRRLRNSWISSNEDR